jgi:hypothetical protein
MGAIYIFMGRILVLALRFQIANRSRVRKGVRAGDALRFGCFASDSSRLIQFAALFQFTQIRAILATTSRFLGFEAWKGSNGKKCVDYSSLQTRTLSLRRCGHVSTVASDMVDLSKPASLILSFVAQLLIVIEILPKA